MTEPDVAGPDSGDPPESEPADRFTDALEARKKAMDYLARREYGRTELGNRLVRAGFDLQTALDAVSRLAEEGLQDDGRFTESFIQSRVHRGRGPVRIRLELGQRGIDAARVDEALADCGEDWCALARAVRQRKFGPARPLEYREKARQMRFLQYRGFEQDQISAAVGSEAD